MTHHNIKIVGIRPAKPSNVGPPGLHLRWSFPPEKGFPSGGFKVYRRSTDKKKNGPKRKVSFSGLTNGHQLNSGSNVDGVEFLFPDSTQIICLGNGQKHLSISPTGQALLELRFPEPVVDVRIEIGDVVGPATLRAYNEAQLIEQTSVGEGVREVVASAITRITIELSFGRLQSIAYTTEAEECNSNWGDAIPLPLPVTAQDARKLLENDLRNYYAGSLADALGRYDPHIEEMIEWLNRLQNPSNDHFVDSTQPPHLLQILNDDGEGEDFESARILNSAYPQSLLLLAALDPNIARMLCLYWVDIFKPEEKGHPQKGAAYDYKVEGIWKYGETLCGLLFNLGAVEGKIPKIEGELTADQLPGFRWSGSSPLARVDLSWPRPEPSPEQHVRAVQPVLYDLVRVADRRQQLVLAPKSPKAAKDTTHFIDSDVSLGPHSYELRPIDLFGQVGKKREVEVDVQDTTAPPPPVRLRTTLSREQTELHFQFEHGALQHQQAPDIKEFNLYWQPNNLFAKLPVRVEASHTVQGDEFLYTLRVSNPDGSTIPYDKLSKFAGDVLTNVLSSAAQPLRADERQRYRISKIEEPDKVSLQPSSNVLSNGNYELVGDPHNRAHWTQLTSAPAPVAWREPIRGVVQTIQEALPVQVRSLPAITARPDPFASLPEDQRKSFPGLPLPPMPEMVDVEIDRDLMEADVFTGDLVRGAPGGIARTGAGNDFNILYAASSTGSGAGARIGLPSDAAVTELDLLSLIPTPEMKVKIRYLVISGTLDEELLGTPGGEIAFEEMRDGAEITHVARVISSAAKGDGTFGFLVRFASEDAANLLQPEMHIRYYAPYRIPLAVSLTDETDAPIELSIPSDAGSRSAYIAVSATDERSNEGPLCTPAQFTVVRPKPSGRPAQPYPCQLDASAEARYSTPGYATPPDRQGRATICLKWDPGDLTPAEGLRYEVARALDNGILAAHLHNWQLGKLEAVVRAPLREGAKVTGDLIVSPDRVRGLHRATFTPETAIPDPSVFRKGRLSQGTTYFEVTLAKRAAADNKVELLLRVSGQTQPVSNAADLEAPPDYSALQNNNPNDVDAERIVVDALKTLAMENSEAFGMATGMPVTAVEFTDEVPGVGRNRFFYRVRAVDAAENRSDWSAISAPFYLADTTPPEVPHVAQPLVGDRTALLIWSRQSNPEIHEYHIYRTEGDPDPFNHTSRSPYVTIRREETQPFPLLNVAGKVTLPKAVEFIFDAGLADDEISRQIAAQIILEIRDDVPAPGNLFDPATGRVAFRRGIPIEGRVTIYVTSLSGISAVPPGTPLRVQAGAVTINGDLSFSTWLDSGLEGAKRYSYRIAAVKKVLIAGSGQPPTEQSIVGEPCAPISVVGLDLSTPPGPQIVVAEWIDADGNRVTASVLGVHLRLTIRAPTNAAFLLVQRRDGDDQPWTNPSVNQQRGWQTWPTGAMEVQFHDRSASPDKSWSYRAQIRTADGRTSEPTEPIEVERL